MNIMYIPFSAQVINFVTSNILQYKYIKITIYYIKYSPYNHAKQKNIKKKLKISSNLYGPIAWPRRDSI